MPPPEPRLLVTCEHGGRRVPREYRSLFEGRQPLLASHRGWDPGALAVARSLARALGAPLRATTITRLLVDANRSPHNPAVFSELTRPLPREARERLLVRHHRPHWERVRAAIGAPSGTTLHLAIHSFAPVWRGASRRFTVGLLYDPRRPGERALASRWSRRLGERLGRREVRRNAPYRGASDGLTTALRRELPGDRYLGIELELNQRVLAGARERRALVVALVETLRAATA